MKITTKKAKKTIKKKDIIKSNKKKQKSNNTKKINNQKKTSIKNLSKNLSKKEIKKILLNDINDITESTLNHLKVINKIIKDQPDSEKWLKKRAEKIIKNMERIEKIYDKMIKELE